MLYRMYIVDSKRLDHRMFTVALMQNIVFFFFFLELQKSG